jgi:flagellar motility protein MotE (MotC chaperone)
MMPRLRPPRLLPITIVALAGLLAVKSSELVRAATGSADAATQTASAVQAAPAIHQPALSAGPSQPAAAKPSEGTVTAPVADAERTVLLELRQRRQELDTREATLGARESMLVAAEQKVTARVTELQVLQNKLEALEATRKDHEDASWQGLVKLYEAMKPRDAATIFNDLEMPVLLQVVDRMKDAKAAPVLAAMQPDKARDLTAKLAQMRTQRDNPGGTVGG